MSYNLPFPGTKAWKKQVEKALKHPNFKVTKLSSKRLDPEEYTAREYSQIHKARKFLIDNCTNK